MSKRKRMAHNLSKNHRATIIKTIKAIRRTTKWKRSIPIKMTNHTRRIRRSRRKAKRVRRSRSNKRKKRKRRTFLILIDPKDL